MPSELVQTSYTETALFKDESLCGESSRDSPEPDIVLGSTYVTQPSQWHGDFAAANTSGSEHQWYTQELRCLRVRTDEQREFQMHTAYLVITPLFAIMVAFSGLGKIRGDPRIVKVIHETVGVPLRYLPLLAACEFAGALGLVLGIWWPPLGVAAGNWTRSLLCGRSAVAVLSQRVRRSDGGARVGAKGYLATASHRRSELNHGWRLGGEQACDYR